MLRLAGLQRVYSRLRVQGLLTRALYHLHCGYLYCSILLLRWNCRLQLLPAASSSAWPPLPHLQGLVGRRVGIAVDQGWSVKVGFYSAFLAKPWQLLGQSSAAIGNERGCTSKGRGWAGMEGNTLGPHCTWRTQLWERCWFFFFFWKLRIMRLACFGSSDVPETQC